MKFIARSLSLAALLGIASAAHAQLTFNFQFDNTFDNSVAPPIIGTGTLNLATDPGNGTFAYSTLNPTYSFNFQGNIFTQANIISNPARTTLILSDNGNGQRRLRFSDTGGGAGGPLFGSLDLQSGLLSASFEPSFFGQGLNRYQLFAFGFAAGQGSYLALTPASSAVPEPGSIALLVGAGISGAGMMLRRRKK